MKIKRRDKKLQKLTYASGFVSYGYKTYGGWEHAELVNPDMNDRIIKSEDVKKEFVII